MTGLIRRTRRSVRSSRPRFGNAGQTEGGRQVLGVARHLRQAACAELFQLVQADLVGGQLVQTVFDLELPGNADEMAGLELMQGIRSMLRGQNHKREAACAGCTLMPGKNQVEPLQLPVLRGRRRLLPVALHSGGKEGQRLFDNILRVKYTASTACASAKSRHSARP